MNKKQINVVDIGEYRVGVGPSGACQHRRVNMDTTDRVIRCIDCDAYLDAFTVLYRLRHAINRELQKIAQEKEKLAQLQNTSRHLIAAQRVEKAWKSKTTVPACPHCGEAILPSDNLGSQCVSKELAEQKAKTR